MKTTASEAKEANSEKFYQAKDDLFFCTQVVALASVATAAIRSMALIEGAGALFTDLTQNLDGLG